MVTILYKIQQWDDNTLDLVCGFSRRAFADQLFLLFSKSGNGLFYVTLTVGVAILEFRLFPSFLIASVTAFAAGLIAHTQIKKVVGRLRPFENSPALKPAFIPLERFSFPSGHTTHAFLMANLLSAFFPVLLLPALAWATMVGLSRIYFRVHYPSDIVAGMILGTLSAQTGILIWL